MAFSKLDLHHAARMRDEKVAKGSGQSVKDPRSREANKLISPLSTPMTFAQVSKLTSIACSDILKIVLAVILPVRFPQTKMRTRTNI
jgi:hypothetical protein